jgi:uncharacterized protein (TIGR03437 family)
MAGILNIGLVQATDRNFCGTTYVGGTSTACPGGCGTVFRLSMGPRPFVATVPTANGLGRQVRILGIDLTGATSITFNGAAATLTVVSPTEITTTVPAGATTGNVEVVTPRGHVMDQRDFPGVLTAQREIAVHTVGAVQRSQAANLGQSRERE